MTWITPFDASTSVIITSIVPFRNTLPSTIDMAMVLPSKSGGGFLPVQIRLRRQP
jgi:hypothetical protein